MWPQICYNEINIRGGENLGDKKQPDREILKVWDDVTTVPEEMKKIFQQYKKEGYTCNRYMNVVSLILEDGIVYIYWENGIIWQEIRSTGETGEEIIERNI